MFVGCGAGFRKMSPGLPEAMQSIGPEGGAACLQVWIDNVLYLNYSNVPFRAVGDTAGFRYMQHTGEWGGGGGTITKTGYWWVDHTVISTTRIGMPGGRSAGDTTSPSVPTGITAR